MRGQCRTTQQGLATATSDLLVSAGVAIAGGAFLFVFSLFLMWRFPYADRSRQFGTARSRSLVLVLAFGFSTQWSVIAMGGKDALAIDMQRVLDQADAIAYRQLRQAAVEANLAPQLAKPVAAVKDLASRETRGAFSGLHGEGTVVATLRNMSQMFGNLGRTVSGVDGDQRALYDRYKELTAEARKVAAETEAADVSESDKIPPQQPRLQPHSRRDQRGRHAHERGDVGDVIKVVNQNLGSLTTTLRAGDTIEQKQALERVDGLKTAAVKVVAADLRGRAAEEDRSIQTVHDDPGGPGHLGLQGRRLGAPAATSPSHDPDECSSCSCTLGRRRGKKKRRSVTDTPPPSPCRCRGASAARGPGRAPAWPARRRARLVAANWTRRPRGSFRAAASLCPPGTCGIVGSLMEDPNR